MTSKKGSWALETFGKIALTIAVLLLMWILLGNVASLLTKATNACNEQGGVCKTPCAGEEESILYNQNGACDKQLEGTVCCTSPEIKEQIEKRLAVRGTRSMVVQVDDRPAIYVVGGRIPLFIGSNHMFRIKLNDEEFNGKDCEVYITDNNDEIVAAYYQDSNDATRLHHKIQGGCNDLMKNEPFNYGPVSFSSNAALNTLKFNIRVKEEAEQKSLGVFNLDVRFPIVFSGLTGRWKQNQDIEITCSQVDCEEVKYWLLPRTIGGVRSALGNLAGVEDVSDETCFGIQRPSYMEEASFINNKAEFTIYNNTFASDEWATFSGRICADILLKNGREIRYFTDTDVLVDGNPPELDISNTDKTIQCKGEEGQSGCTHYYYYVNADITTSTIMQEQNLENWAEDQITTWLETAINTRRICNPIGVGYRSTTIPVINDQTALAGTVCAYARDAAGNYGEPKLFTFGDRNGLGTTLARKGVQSVPGILGGLGNAILGIFN